MKIKANVAFTVALGILLLFGFGCSKESKHARYTARGDDYVAKEQFAKAEIEYLNAIRLNPNEVAVIKKLARVYFAQGRNATALAALGNFKSKQPNDIEAHTLAAELLFRMNSFASARDEALIVVTNQPTNAAALLIIAETSLGSTQMLQADQVFSNVAKTAAGAGLKIAQASLAARRGDLASAESHLKEAVRLNASGPEIDLAFAKLRFAQTNVVEGEALVKRASDASPAYSYNRLRWIDLQITHGNFAVAKKALEKLRTEAPDFLPPIVRLAAIALAEQDMEECEQLTKTALRLDSGSHDALILRARMWTAQRKFDSATDELVRLDALFAKNAAVKVELAAAYARAGEPAKALTTVTEALRIDPQLPAAGLLQAEINLRQGNTDAAINTLLNLRKRNPELRKASVLLANTYSTAGRFDEAIRVLREATVRNPNDYDAWTALGITLRKQKADPKEVRAALEQSLKLSPAFVPAVEHLVSLDLEAKNIPAALARASALKAAATNSAAGHVLEARVHFAGNDLKAAEASLLGGLEREPKNSAIYGMLADLYAKSGDHQKAIEKLDHITSNSTNAFAAWTTKGLLFEQLGQTDKAVSAYESALKINKNVPVALNNLAVISSRDSKRLKEAQEFAERAAKNAPESVEIADTLGWIMYQRGDFTGARRVFADLATKSSHPEIQFHAGMTFYAAGDTQRAQQSLSQAANAESLAADMRKQASNRLAIIATDVKSATASDVQQLESAIKENRGDYLAHFLLATIYQVKGDLDKAATTFKAAANLQPQSAQPLLALARIHAGRDDKAALAFARDARKLAPTDPAVAATLGATSVRTKAYVAGYSLLLEAQRAGALTSPNDRYQFALAQLAAGRTTDALATLNDLATTAPAHLQQAARETITLLTGDSTQKSTLAQARLKADPDDLVGLIANADLAFNSGDAKKAADAYQKVLAAAPNYIPAHHRLAMLYIDSLNDEKSAYSHAMKAREAAPNDPQIARVLAKIALERKNYADALRFAEESSRGLQNDGEPYYLIGAAQLSLKRTNEAKIALSKAATLPLNATTEASNKRLLAELK